MVRWYGLDSRGTPRAECEAPSRVWAEAKLLRVEGVVRVQSAVSYEVEKQERSAIEREKRQRHG